MRSGRLRVDLDLELIPEVDFADFLVIQDSLGITFCDYLTFADDVRLLADVECFPDIVIGQKYAYVPRLEMLNDLLDFTNGNGVDAREWFIQ